MPSTLQDSLVSQLKFAHDRVLELIDDFPDEQAFFQSAPTDGHLLWTLGHLAITNEWLMSKICANGSPVTLDKAWQPLFGFGSVVQAESTLYPDLASVRGQFDTSHAEFVNVISSLNDDQLLDPAPADRSGGHIPTAAAAAGIKAWHDGWHAGQLSSLRKALGLARVMDG